MSNTRSTLLLSLFLVALLLLTMTSLYALYLNQRVTTVLGQGDENLEDVTMAAAEVSSYAKRAEGHLLLYLSLHRETDKTKFPQRVASLQEQIALLDHAITNSASRNILDEIKANSRNILSLGEVLIAAHDHSMAASGTFDPAAYGAEIDHLHGRFSSIRRLGVTLVSFEVSRRNDVKLDLLNETEELRFYLLALIVALSGLIAYLGYRLARSVRRLQNSFGEQ